MRSCCRARRSTCACASTRSAPSGSRACCANAAPEDIARRVDEERRSSGALEVAVFGGHERIVAASFENPLETLPSRPPADLVRQVSERRTYVSLEPEEDGQYLIRTAAPFADSKARIRTIATSSRSIACRRSSPRCPKPCSTRTRSTAISPRCASR